MIVMPENIILWRHAEAKDVIEGDGVNQINTLQIDTTQSDLQRALTQKGLQQASDMAKWLKVNLPKNVSLQCSPALRAYQTAKALQALNKSYKINITQALKPNASLHAALGCITQSNSADSLVIVGHQPCLGQLAAHLFGFAEAEIAIKKGAFWWLRLNKARLKDKSLLAQYNIHTVQTPSLF